MDKEVKDKVRKDQLKAQARTPSESRTPKVRAKKRRDSFGRGK